MRQAGKWGDGVTVNNVTEGGRYVYGKDAGLPTGWRFDTQTGEASAIPGGPAAQEAENRVTAATAKKAAEARTSNIVIEDIDRALAAMDDSFLPVAGAVGGALSNIPGTAAFDVSKLIETVKANSGFDKLQAMRDASPTGGALGQVSERELAFLQSTIGSLSQSQSPEQFRRNLMRVRKAYDDRVAARAQSRRRPPHNAERASRLQARPTARRRR